FAGDDVRLRAVRVLPQIRPGGAYQAVDRVPHAGIEGGELLCGNDVRIEAGLGAEAAGDRGAAPGEVGFDVVVGQGQAQVEDLPGSRLRRPAELAGEKRRRQLVLVVEEFRRLVAEALRVWHGSPPWRKCDRDCSARAAAGAVTGVTSDRKRLRTAQRSPGSFRPATRLRRRGPDRAGGSASPIAGRAGLQGPPTGSRRSRRWRAGAAPAAC